ncbi:glutamine dumper 5 [Euphorbia peplus]|nr:glutamine dumper 5 [Euphorbia peplus]
MRPMRTLSSTGTPFPASIPSPATMQLQTRSPWHSPIPYLFGGLAAMLGLIAFALLILACSYWRLSGRLDSGDDQDVENGNEKDAKLDGKGKVYEEKILVIMAGDQTPTFLATPVLSRAPVLNVKIENREDEEKTEQQEEKKKEEFDGEGSEREEPMN